MIKTTDAEAEERDRLLLGLLKSPPVSRAVAQRKIKEAKVSAKLAILKKPEPFA